MTSTTRSSLVTKKSHGRSRAGLDRSKAEQPRGQRTIAAAEEWLADLPESLQEVSMRFADLATWIRRGVLDANENKLQIL